MKEQVLFIALYSLIGFIMAFYTGFIHDGGVMKEMSEQGISEGLPNQHATCLAYAAMFIFGAFWPVVLVWAAVRKVNKFTKKQP